MRTNITLEQALQKASRRLREKMKYSVNLLQKAESLALAYGWGNFGYYLAFSAGKDSQALYHIAELAGVKFDAHMNLTSVDPPELVQFIKKQKDVFFDIPKDKNGKPITMWSLIAGRKIPPTRLVNIVVRI